MGQVTLFAQQKGGAGKTTLLTQLAVHLAGQGARVILIDIDPQRSTTGWFRVRADRLGPANALRLVESADWRIGTDIRAAAKEADHVLVDAPGSGDALGRGAMREAGLALIPCQPSMADVWASAATIRMAGKEKLAHALVLNRFPARGRAAAAAAAALAETGAPILATRIGARAAFADAFMRGAGVTESHPRGPAAAEIRALAAEIWGG